MIKEEIREKENLRYRTKRIHTNRTQIGLLKQMYDKQRSNSSKRGHVMPNYSKQELIELYITTKLFNNLYNSWVESGYDRWCRPSFDRLDNSKPYTFDNIQLMTWKENHENGVKERAKSFCKRVKKYDLDDNFIREYKSVTEASEDVSLYGTSGVSRACRGIQKTAGGFKWLYV